MNSALDLSPSCAVSEPRYNILTEQYELLHCMLTRGDVNRVIDERQSMPEQYPKWQCTLIVKRVMPAVEESSYRVALRRHTWPDVMPLPASNAHLPTIYWIGDNLGLASECLFITVECGDWRGDICLEEALFNIDRFTDGGQQRILKSLPYHFDMTEMSRTTTTQSWGVSFAGTVIAFATKSEAKRFIRDNNKDVADRRGGTFKAVIVRIPASKEATH